MLGVMKVGRLEITMELVLVDLKVSKMVVQKVQMMDLMMAVLSELLLVGH